MTATERWLRDHWREKWERAADGKTTLAWQTPWEVDGQRLYQGLRKEEATLAFLLRSEIIGLRDWLYRVKVPGYDSPQCTCGWERQTVKHVVTQCPDISHREEMFLQSKSSNFRTILSTKKGLQAVTRWLIKYGKIEQFKVAGELAKDRDQKTRSQALPELREGSSRSHDRRALEG